MDEVVLAHLMFLPFIVAMLVVGALGEMIQRLIPVKAGDTGWRGVYYITKSYHPIFFCMLLWSIPGMPMPEGDPTTLMARLFAGAGIGAVTMICYELIVKTIRKVVITFGEQLGGLFSSWASKLGGSSNTPTKRTTPTPPDSDAEQ